MRGVGLREDLDPLKDLPAENRHIILEALEVYERQLGQTPALRRANETKLRRISDLVHALLSIGRKRGRS